MKLFEKHITIKDVAVKAGVSATAVSMFLNGKAKQYQLSDDTCKKIAETIRQTHYIPNFHAHAMASGKSGMIGILISDSIAHSFWVNILSSLEDSLAAHGLHPLLAVTGNNAQRQKNAFRYMNWVGADGFIAAPVTGTENEIKRIAKQYPFVTMNQKIPGISGVWNDDFAGIKSAVDCLVRAGHSKIAFIGQNRGGAVLLFIRQCRSIFFPWLVIPTFQHFSLR